jgi:hypothetical protein
MKAVEAVKARYKQDVSQINCFETISQEGMGGSGSLPISCRPGLNDFL